MTTFAENQSIKNHGRQALIILGMHRSGTSALAGTLVRLGAAEPQSPLDASADNPSGFYESYPVVVANHVILERAHCAWNACLWFDPLAVSGPHALQLRPLLQRVLRTEFGDAPQFVFKDPRLCLTLPPWLTAMDAMGIAPVVLIACRHPAEVVRSLTVRNQRPEDESAANWLHHMLEAERLSRGLPRAVVFYDELMADWRRCIGQAAGQAGISWRRTYDMAAEDVHRFLAPSLRHHRATQVSAAIGPDACRDLIQTTWMALGSLRRDPSDPVARECLDHIWEKFARWRRATYPPGTKVVWEAA